MQKAHQWCQGSVISIFPFVIIIIFYKIEFCIGKACFVATSKLYPMIIIFSYLHIFNVELSLNSDHFKEPLNYLSLLSEITLSWGVGIRPNSKHIEQFSFVRVLLHQKINFVYIIIVVTFHVDQSKYPDVFEIFNSNICRMQNKTYE